MSTMSTGLGREERTRSILSSKWDGRDAFSVEETANILGLSRPTAYAAVKTGDLPSIRVGRRLIVPRYALEKMLAGA
jgi:excisionase family DNA binding protein